MTKHLLIYPPDDIEEWKPGVQSPRQLATTYLIEVCIGHAREHISPPLARHCKGRDRLLSIGKHLIVIRSERAGTCGIVGAVQQPIRQVTYPPRDSCERWWHRLRARKVHDPIPFPKSHVCLALLPWMKAPAARDRLPQILFIGQTLQTRHQTISRIIKLLE